MQIFIRWLSTDVQLLVVRLLYHADVFIRRQTRRFGFSSLLAAADDFLAVSGEPTSVLDKPISAHSTAAPKLVTVKAE